MSINGFNIAAEFIDFIIASVVLYLAVCTRPRKTSVFSLVLGGLITSLANIVLHVLVAGFCVEPQVVSGVLFNLLVAAYYLTYLLILLFLFSYVHLLTLKQRENLKSLNTECVIFSIAYLIVVGYVFFTGQYYEVVDGVAGLTPLFNINLAFGLADVVIVVSSAFANKEGLPKVMLFYLCLFMPLEPVLLIGQMIHFSDIFLSITYVLPFVLVYIVFHSIYYDEVTGCQNKEAFASHYMTLRGRKKPFTVVYVKFPRLEQFNTTQTKEAMLRLVSAQCRKMEKLNSKACVYMINDYTFGVIIASSQQDKTQKTKDYIHLALEKAMADWEFTHMPEYKMVAFQDDLSLKHISEVEYFATYLFEKATREKVNYYDAIQQDYYEAVDLLRIENVIVDIRDKGNLEDERVLVYMQPIYGVATERFRTAEALMRLVVDGEIISPNVFIPIAERNGCIHTLTLIILNKVCHKIYEIQDYYLFDAVSVNVSLSEFMDYCLHEELIGIIKKNGISPQKIRLEMTESMTSDEIDAISHNMEEFTRAGVSFYLDDFGTGYSNLERIISLPFKTIKFDKSLLYKSLEDPILMQLIQNMVEVFKKHGLIVLVEGVENEKQAHMSREVGFEYIQGFNYSAPVPINRIQEFFEKKKRRVG